MQSSDPLYPVAHNADCITSRVTTRTEVPCIYVLYFSKHRRTLHYIQDKIRNPVQPATFQHARTRGEAVNDSSRLSSLHLSKLRTNLGSNSRIPISNGLGGAFLFTLTFSTPRSTGCCWEGHCHLRQESFLDNQTLTFTRVTLHCSLTFLSDVVICLQCSPSPLVAFLA